ncbi:minor capsid protein [Enterocloster clostridioformis]|uniref:phage minor capsid protein n=3 Tax=Enterocloster clostridioformis TaxID=1531 RepID=UPI00080C90CC|nr:phage minor capsid protein [Enterocloster clostridioformis]ANU47753.1 minor capsid protein [Lachnoclostridium sp. YL32]NDO30599.1 minor capsid protein [Enterocloster clostridioformis]OXE66060.1 minor capsid protein [Enterocloster clostridioformis]QQR03346.1 minor capsid protein [Enterocloster clostridioformis]
MTEYDIGAAFQAIEKELMASMIRNMDRHRAEETKEGIEWSMWQTEQMKALEKYKKDNQKRYRKQFQDLNKEMGELIRISRQKGNMQQEIQILNAIRKGFPARKISKGATAEFFKLNDRKLEALIQATTNDMQKAETAVLRKANDDYRKAIFNAQVYANSGAGTYEKAVDMATKDMLSRGLNCVEYANGARHTLADYADMAIRTASKRAYLQGEGEKRQEWGITTVIVNKRGNPCPKCLPFVGKVLIDDVWSGGKKSDGLYPLMSQAIAAGLYHPRCKDSHTTYFPGISTADDTWTKEELDAVERANQKETKRQYAERQAEKFRRLVAYSLDKENQERYMAKREEWGTIAKDTEPDIIKPIDTEEEIQVHPVGKIDKEIYKCITEDIVTDEVIITDERIGHIKERHPNDYEKYCEYLKLIVEEPDYIVETKKPNTALILKEIKESNERQFKTVLRLTTSTDNPGFKNSIITFMKIDEKEWNRLLRNKLILYKKE